jgi:ComF family protein
VTLQYRNRPPRLSTWRGVWSLRVVLGVLFRETCPACGGVTGAGFCAVCAADLPRTSDPCAGCGLARPVARCPRRAAQWQVEAVVAPFAYAPPLDHYIQQLKYAGTRSLGRAFGLTLAPAVRDACRDVDVLVAVPLHPTRLRERGYNQAIEIARPLCRALALPLLLRGVERRLASPSQTVGSAVQRQASVAAAFHVARSLAGLRIAIVDDVITTGATVNALAAALLAAGATRCIAVAAARTPETVRQPRNR